MNKFKIISASRMSDFQMFVENYIKDKKVIAISVTRPITELTPSGYYEAYIIVRD